jgi:acyl-CoA synthetase (AMP-forming)/AMP-acid ligase II
MEIGALIRNAAQRYGDAPALECEGRTVSFKEFDQATDRIGNALLARGINPGDRVGVMLPNGIECLAVYYALAKAGLVRVPLNDKDTVEQNEYKIDDSQTRAIIITAMRRPTVRRLRSSKATSGSRRRRGTAMIRSATCRAIPRRRTGSATRAAQLGCRRRSLSPCAVSMPRSPTS